MITRTYKTKEDCARLMLIEDFDAIPCWIVTEAEDWFERWSFQGVLDEEEAEEQEADYGYVDAPMWSTWWSPNGFSYDWIEAHQEEVMDLGFTLIYYDDELIALGIDGMGYSFYEHHWIPLYDAMGLHWHDEEDTE